MELSQELGFAKTKAGWLRLVGFCAGQKQIGYVYTDTQTLSRQYQKLLEYAGFSRQSPDERTNLTEPKISHNRAVGAQYVFDAGKGSIGFNFENGLVIGETCDLSHEFKEEEPRFLCATSKQMVYLYDDRELHYKTIDHNNETPAHPSLLLSSGTIKLVSPGRIQATFINGDYSYRIDFGINSRVPGASVTVLKYGLQIQSEECRFYSFNRPLVNVTYSLDKTFRPSSHVPAHAATLANGRVVVMSMPKYFTTSSSALYDPETQAWVMTSPMHYDAFAAWNWFLLPNRDLLVWGWYQGTHWDAANGGMKGNLWVDLFNERTSSWSKPPELRDTSAWLIALPSGKILAVHNRKTDQTTSILDLDSLSWSQGPLMHYASARNQVFQLHDGRILVLHGDGVLSGTVMMAEVYDPERNKWGDLGFMPAQKGELMNLGILDDGRVYLTWWNDNHITLYDPQSNRWTLSAPCKYGESFGLNAVPVGSSRLLFSGKSRGRDGKDEPHMFTYDASTNQWSDAALPPSYREPVKLTWLRMGKDLVAYYHDYETCDSHLAVYLPDKDTWQPLPSPRVCRTDDAILKLPRRRLLVYGTPVASLDPNDFAEIVPVELKQ